LSSLLNTYAKKLKSEQRYMDTLIDRPNLQNKDYRYFVRYMEKYHTASFGIPLHEIISIIAGVFFPDLEVSLESVRSSLRNQ
jgi:hypothetical protein